MAPVIRELRARPQTFKPLVLVTAQHRDMLDEAMSSFDIRGNVDLHLMEVDQTPSHVMGKVLLAIDKVFLELRPDITLVQGDTTTAMAVSIAAFLNKIPLGHVEAGLRSWDKFNPFPEESNRRVISLIADWHFAPTQTARMNLLREGVREETVYVTGNTVIDALLLMVNEGTPVLPGRLTGIDFGTRRTILVTAHRRENHGERLVEICRALRKLVKRNSDIQVVFPVHPNPNVENTVHAHLEGIPRIHLVPPLGYQTMVNLMSSCYLILTDSGGIQEEAPSLGKPVLVLREVTERQEVVDAGVARLVGTNSEVIVQETERLLHNPEDYAAMSGKANPFGDGTAARRIAGILEGGRSTRDGSRAKVRENGCFEDVHSQLKDGARKVVRGGTVNSLLTRHATHLHSGK